MWGIVGTIFLAMYSYAKNRVSVNEKWRSNVCDLRNLYKVTNIHIRYLDLGFDLLVGLHVH